MFKAILVAGTGGFLGTSLRFIINKIFPLQPGGFQFPVATFIVNLVGCFLFGLFWGWLKKYDLLSSELYGFLITGFCGGLTTFSTFSNELNNFTTRGEWFIFMVYLILSIIFGLLLLWLGKQLIN